MSALIIDNLPAHVRDWLAAEAARHGRSVADEARDLLAQHAERNLSSARPRVPPNVAEAQRRFREALGDRADGFSVDEFIAERRAEARREMDEE